MRHKPIPFGLDAELLAQSGDPAWITEFTATPTLVLSPHMDDEVLGCGGSLVHHVQAGAAVTVLYLTDSGLGGPHNDTPAERAYNTQVRKNEAREVAELLQLHHQIFLDEPDGQLKTKGSSVQQVVDVFLTERPAVVYGPSPLDGHVDHWHTNRILIDAVKRLGDVAAATVYRGYEIWGMTLANAVVDITAVWPLKVQAMARYQSQLSDCDFPRTIGALNTYRSQWLHGRGYAEAFFQCPLPRYCEILEQVCEPVEQWHAKLYALREALR